MADRPEDVDGYVGCVFKSLVRLPIQEYSVNVLVTGDQGSIVKHRQTPNVMFAFSPESSNVYK